jgi:hypothetical protein
VARARSRHDRREAPDRRYSYVYVHRGTPQSLGCVELPEASAKKVWPYTPIGTLVTIEH